MTMLTRWDPFRELEDMHNRLSTFFNRAPARLGWGDGGESLALADWSPAVDITEDDKEYLIKAELPEMKKEEVKVTVENGVLSISGERKLEEEKKGISDDIRDVYMEAKAVGYDPKIMRQIVRLRKMKPDDRSEQDMLLETYKNALGMA